MKPARAHAPLIAAIGACAPICLLALGGCGGFTPLYATPGVGPKLAAIQVLRPDGRTGFLMGQYLDDDFVRNRDQPPVYRLALKSREVRIPRGLRINNVASRYEVDLTTTYTLVEIATNKTVTSGQVAANVTYDSADQPYAGIAAEEDGEERAAEQVALRIRIQIAAFFASPKPGGATPAPVSDLASATYSERLQPATVLSPRERALGQPTPQGGQADLLGLPLQSTTPESATPPQPFSPSQDPNAIKTLPETSDQ